MFLEPTPNFVGGRIKLLSDRVQAVASPMSYIVKPDSSQVGLVRSKDLPSASISASARSGEAMPRARAFSFGPIFLSKHQQLPSHGP
jgi:hypothetical protein